MNFIVLTDPPSEPGDKFVATWIHNGRLWADEYEVREDGLYKYLSLHDEYMTVPCPDWDCEHSRIKDSMRFLVAATEG